MKEFLEFIDTLLQDGWEQYSFDHNPEGLRAKFKKKGKKDIVLAETKMGPEVFELGKPV